MGDDEIASLRRHIRYKVAAGELAAIIGHRMQHLLDQGSPPDYQTLLGDAQWPPPPQYCYHTAPIGIRDQIRSGGLRPHLPAEGRWGDGAARQARGVYVTTFPDERGIWSDDEVWDVWRVEMTDLDWWRDTINPGCYRIDAAWPDRLTFEGTYTR